MDNIFISLSEERLREIVEESVTNCISRQKISAQKEPMELLSRLDTARYLKISLPTLDKLTKTDKIIAHRVGRKKMYRLSEIQKCLTSSQIRYK